MKLIQTILHIANTYWNNPTSQSTAILVDWTTDADDGTEKF